MKKKAASMIVEIQIQSTTVDGVDNLSLGITEGKTWRQQFLYQHDQWKLLRQKENIVRPFICS